MDLLNVREAIEQRASRHGWSRIVGDIDGEIWARGEDRVAIRYRLYGSQGSQRLCRWYGKDDGRHVNWGIETAVHGDELITGKNKKGQVLACLKNG